ncbi:MAG: hypothetical protein AAFR63_11755 [Cyanobacteria bacterium J06631_6]
MVLQTVFSNNLNPATGSLTARFMNATAFYIDAPLLNAEMEIDVFLQVYFPSQSGERLRNLPLGKLKDGIIKLNETDTETVVPIPNEFVDSGLEMALFFLSSDETFIEVYILGKDCTLCNLDLKIDAILENLETIGSEDFADNLLQFAIDNLLPILIQNLLPGVNGLITSALTNLVLPAIQNLLPGGVPALPAAAANNIALTGSTVAFGSAPPTTNNNTNIRFF